VTLGVQLFENARLVFMKIGVRTQFSLYTYRELFRMPMEHRQIHAIREALNHELVLGREDFKEKIERMSKRQVRPSQPGRPRVKEEQAVYYVL
jgi:putative transposase